MYLLYCLTYTLLSVLVLCTTLTLEHTPVMISKIQHYIRVVRQGEYTQADKNGKGCLW